MKSVTLLQLNDLHGYLAPHAELFDLGRQDRVRSGGGLARMATRFTSIRRDVGPGVIALDNGDTFHGTMPAVGTRGQAMVPPLRHLGLDGMTVHWEFAFGLGGLRDIADALAYPILGANCHFQGTPVPCRPFTLIDRAGVKVAVIGLAAVLAPHLLPPLEREAVDITLGDAELKSLIPALRRDHAADLVVVLSHLGFPQDYKLATEVPGIDVILSGHTHNRLASPATAGSTLIIQSGAHGSFVGRLDLDLAPDGIAGWTHALLPIDDDVAEDPETQSAVREALAPFAAANARVVGETTCTLHRYAMFESTMDNLLLDATAAAAGTTVALSNGWRYGAPIPPGPLTEADLWNIVPANPEVSVIGLTGRELRALFENNLDATFACDPWEQRGGVRQALSGDRDRRQSGESRRAPHPAVNGGRLSAAR